MITVVGYGVGRKGSFGSKPIDGVLYVGTDVKTRVSDLATEVVEEYNRFSKPKLILTDPDHMESHLYTGEGIDALLDNKDNVVSRIFKGRTPAVFNIWSPGYSGSSWFEITKLGNFSKEFSTLTQVLYLKAIHTTLNDPDCEVETENTAQTLLEQQGL